MRQWRVFVIWAAYSERDVQAAAYGRRGSEVEGGVGGGGGGRVDFRSEDEVLSFLPCNNSSTCGHNSYDNTNSRHVIL